MARRDQQIDASNFVYSIDRKIAPFLKITASKRAPHGSEFANRRKKGVRIPPVRGKQWLASMESFVNFRAEKARKRLMPLAFRQWHLYRFDFMVPVVGLEPTRCRHQRILSPSRLPIPSYRRGCRNYYTQGGGILQERISAGAEKIKKIPYQTGGKYGMMIHMRISARKGR